MSWFPRPAAPRALWADQRHVAGRGDRRYKLVALAVAVGMTSLIITLFVLEARHGILPEGPQITYAADYRSDRTDAEIVASQKVDQRERAAALAEKRRQFRKVDDAMSRWGL
jgi:hypothetical protein